MAVAAVVVVLATGGGEVSRDGFRGGEGEKISAGGGGLIRIWWETLLAPSCGFISIFSTHPILSGNEERTEPVRGGTLPFLSRQKLRSCRRAIGSGLGGVEAP